MILVYDMGLRLKELRIEKHLTQKQVGLRIGTSPNTISGYEANTAIPPTVILRKIALLYGVTSDYLLGIDDRDVIVLEEDLSESQVDTVKKTVEIICAEFKKDSQKTKG